MKIHEYLIDYTDEAGFNGSIRIHAESIRFALDDAELKLGEDYTVTAIQELS